MQTLENCTQTLPARKASKVVQPFNDIIGVRPVFFYFSNGNIGTGANKALI